MAYPAVIVANTLLDIAWKQGADVTPMKLQKLVYIAHGWHLAIYDEPLLSHPVQAWKYGPVIQSLYDRTRIYGASPVTDFIPPNELDLEQFGERSQELVPKRDERAWAVLRKVWEEYGALSAVELSALTHQRGTPWYKIWNDDGGKERRGSKIDDTLIAEHYKALGYQDAA